MPFNTLFNFGVVGVDLFFVVSGFIILHSTMGKMQTVKDYAFRTYALARIRRIFLPYWPIGLVMAVMTYGFFPYDSLTLRGWVASATLLPVGKTGLNVAWTLQHEVVFYALVALGLFSGWWRIGLVLWSAAILSFWLGNLNAPVGLQPIDSEFLMGIAAWAAWRSENRPTMIATSAALGLLSVLLYTNGANFGFDRSEPIAAAAFFAAILPWLVNAETAGVFRTPPVLRFLGDASYSIYIVHAVTQLLAIKLLAGHGWEIILPTIAFTGLATGIAYHILVERVLLRLNILRPAKNYQRQPAPQISIQELEEVRT